jgi:hypothetical protein
MPFQVNVTYHLSPAGQKAALLAGLPASALQQAVLLLNDPGLIDRLQILADGSLQYATFRKFDAPFSIADDLVLQDQAELEQEKQANAQRELEQKQAREKRQAEEAALLVEKIAAHKDKVAEILKAVEATSKLELNGSGVQVYQSTTYYGIQENIVTHAGVGEYRCDDADYAALKALKKDIATQEEAQKKADKEAKAEALKTMLAENDGGYVFKREGDMTDFKGYNFWCAHQTKRWVGIFSGARGIDTFLDSPRGEWTFDVSSLEPGDMIQGGGYDSNSRGKRRNESEFFGLVLKNEPERLIIWKGASRSDVMKEKVRRLNLIEELSRSEKPKANGAT